MAFSYFDQPPLAHLVQDGPHRTVEDIKTFKANLESRYGFDKLHLDTLFIDQVYLLAGGSVLNSIQCNTSDAFTNSDLDIFVLGETDEKQEKHCRALLKHLGSLAPFRSGKIWFGNLCNVICVWFEEIACMIQIIRLPDCKIVDDVLCNFDQTCCQWGYTGSQVWCTAEALTSLATSTNRANKDLFNRLSHYNPDKTVLKLARRMRKMEARGFHTILDGEQPGSTTNCHLGQSFRDTLLFPDNPQSVVARPTFHNAYVGKNKELLRSACGITHVTMSWTQVRITKFIDNNIEINRYTHKYDLDDWASGENKKNIPFRKAYKVSGAPRINPKAMVDVVKEEDQIPKKSNEVVMNTAQNSIMPSVQEETYFSSLMKMLRFW